MKKMFLWIVTVLFVLTSCTEDVVLNESVANGRLQASFEGSSFSSRLAIGEGNALVWTATDAFTLFNEAGESSSWTLEGNGGTELGTFVGSELEGTLKGAAFPASASPVYDGGLLSMVLPSEINYEKSICNLPMWASFSSLDATVSFKHLGALLKIDFTDIPSGYTSLVVTADKAIAGTFSADLSESEPVLQEKENTSKSVTVSFAPISGDDNDRLFYLPLPVGTYESINVSISNGTNTLSIADWTNREIKRKKVYLASLTYRVSNAHTGTAVSEELADMIDSNANATIELTEKIDAADGAIVIPAEASKVGLSFNEVPTTTEDVPLAVQEENATTGAQLNISLPTSEEVYIALNTPTTTVNVESGNYKKITARTAANTLILGKNSTVVDLIVLGGNVVLDGGKIIGSITRDDSNTDEVTYVYVESESELEGVTIGEGIVIAAAQVESNGAWYTNNPDAVEFEIGSKEEFIYFMELQNNMGVSFEGKTVKLTSDLDFSGYEGNLMINMFKGTFDGQNHSIKNLKINSTEKYIGLFAQTENSTIKNLRLIGGYVRGYSTARGVAAFVGYGEGVVLINCHNISCSVLNEQGTTFTSGIAGCMYDSTIIACSNSVDIDALRCPCGLAYGGWGAGTNYVACFNTGNISATNSSVFATGLVVEFNGGGSYMYGCFNSGSIPSGYNNGTLTADSGLYGTSVHYSYSSYNEGTSLLGQCWSGANETVGHSSYKEAVANLNKGIEMYNASATIPCEYRFVAGDTPALEKSNAGSGITVYQLKYTSTDGQIVNPYKCSTVILSNTYNNGVGVIEFESPITTIDDSAFSECTTLKSIQIPSTVTRIGGSAFYNCTALEGIEIPNSVTEIGEWAFLNCSSLKDVKLSENLSVIRENVFGQCHALESIVIPDNVTILDFRAFNTCSNLKDVTLSNNLTTIGRQAFIYNKSLTTITIPEKVTAIGNNAFTGDGGEGGLKTIYCKPATPPTIDFGFAFSSSGTIDIYVPANSLEAYTAAWGSQTGVNIIASSEF